LSKYLKLDVFSGIPNPVWPISDDLATQYGQQTVTADQAPQGLGYRGFQVLDAPDASSSASGATPLAGGSTASGAATTEDQIGSFTITGVISGASDTEKALLQSGVDAGAIGGDLAGYVGGLIGSTSSSSLSGGGGAALPAAAPTRRPTTRAAGIMTRRCSGATTAMPTPMTSKPTPSHNQAVAQAKSSPP